MKTTLTQKEIVESVLEIPETVSIDELFNLSKVTLRDVLYIITHNCGLTDLELRELLSRCIEYRFKNLINVPISISAFPKNWNDNESFEKYMKSFGFKGKNPVQVTIYRTLDEIYYYWYPELYSSDASAADCGDRVYFIEIIKDFIKEKSDK